nr:reverse transcriptase domain-containing protein [Tanacetum cinerariifolium]
MYVDGGSASEIMYEHCFSRIHLEIKKQLIPATTPLIGFSGEIIWPIGQIQLLVKIEDEEHSASAWMNFMVAATSCVDYSRATYIFAWKSADMTGIPIHIAEYRLNVREGCSPVRQKKRGQSADKNQAIQKEVGKLVKAGIMREAFKKMKQLIAELSMVKALMEKEELIVYLVAAKETVSAVLMMERKVKLIPIYFVSWALRGLKLNYTSMEKLVLALVHVKHLKRPRVSVKRQILADFIVERPEEDSLDTQMEEEESSMNRGFCLQTDPTA